MSSIRPDPDILPSSVVEAWRADTASTSELRAGYARFMRRRLKRNTAPRVAAFVVGALVLGIGLAQAASMVPARWLGQREVAVTPPHATLSSAKVAPSAFVKRESAPIAAPVPAPVQAVPAPVPASRMLPPGSAPATEPYVEEQWQRAASALRDDDFERARSALLEIERNAVGAEGDAARLARAQLLASHGKNAQALELAGALVDQAESALVRDKARRLVARLTKNEIRDRSAEPGAADKQP